MQVEWNGECSDLNVAWLSAVPMERTSGSTLLRVGRPSCACEGAVSAKFGENSLSSHSCLIVSSYPCLGGGGVALHTVE